MSVRRSQLGVEGQSTTSQRCESRLLAVDETVTQLNDDRFWLYAAVNLDTTRLLYVKLASTQDQAIIEIFRSELRESYLVDDMVFPVDSAPWLQAALCRYGINYQRKTYVNRNNVKRVF